MKGWFNRDEEGKVIIDSNGFVTITCEGNEARYELYDTYMIYSFHTVRVQCSLFLPPYKVRWQ